MVMEGKGTRLKLRGGTWYIVSQGNTRGRSTRTGDRAAAERALGAFIQQRDRQDEVKGVGLLASTMLDDYLKEHARPNIAAIEQAEIACDYFRAYFPAGKLASAVTEEDIAGYVTARRECAIKRARDPRPAGNGTIRRELGTLVAAFNHAVRKKRLAAGSIPHIAPPAAPPPKNLWLTPDDEAALLAACPVETVPSNDQPEPRLTRIYRFIMLAADTAARKEALEKLTWFQVDFGAGFINLNPQGRLQTKKRRSVIPMSTRLRAVLERAYREKESGWVLDNPGSIRASMETLTAKARMGWVTPHVFRHTWATRAARAGVSMVDIADFLGDDLRTVEKNYRHHSPDFLRGAADWREREADRTNIAPA
jgi:integrase